MDKSNTTHDSTICFPSGFFNMGVQNSRSRELLNKVFDYLDTIDVTKLSMNEMKDFLEVVQKGQFLESFGQIPGYGLTNFCAAPFNGPKA